MWQVHPGPALPQLQQARHPGWEATCVLPGPVREGELMSSEERIAELERKLEAAEAERDAITRHAMKLEEALERARALADDGRPLDVVDVIDQALNTEAE